MTPTTTPTPSPSLVKTSLKQDHPGQENYKQPYKIIYHGFIHSIKYILISFLGSYPVWIDEKMSAYMTAQVSIN